MANVRDILNYVETLAPRHMAMEWDHIGLLCGRADREVKRVMVALDPFMHVAEEAAEQGCQLLLTHHPAMWKLDKFNDETQQGRVLLYLTEKGISAVNAHTNLDCAPGGVNDRLAAVLGLSDVQVIDPMGQDDEGREYGLLRGGSIGEISSEAFVQMVKGALSCEHLRYATTGRGICRVAVGGGSCSDGLKRVAELGYDAFVTADCKYNAFADALDYGITLVDAGHFHTENPVCAVLAEKVQEAFPDIDVILSKSHGDCIKFL